MKKISVYLLCLVSAGLLLACGGVNKTKEVISESSDKANQIKISGSRGTSLDPFQTSIIINGYDQSDTLMTEIYARDLTKENVLFTWSDNSKCRLTFVQQDDSKRVMDVMFKEDGNLLREVSQ
jgi:hypothetical protein